MVEKVVTDSIRMVMRAFYSDSWIVIVDTILREKNYISDDEIISKLGMSAKDVRTALVHLKDFDLICRQRRDFQMPVPTNPNRTRRIQRDYWYVEYRSFLDIVKYKIDRIRRDIEDRVSVEAAQHQLYHCVRCGAEYTALDIVEMLQGDGLVCTRPINRKQTCGGRLEEDDVAGRRAELENLQERFESELRPLLERINQCDELDIPLQPAPETDAIRPKQAVAAIDVEQPDKPMDAEGVVVDLHDENEDANAAEGKKTKGPLQPVWFREDLKRSGGGVELNEGEPKEAGDEPAYGDDNLYDYYGDDAEQPADANADMEVAAADANGAEHPAEEAVVAVDVDTYAPDAADDVIDVHMTADADGAANGTQDGAEPLISVGSERVPISKITDEHSSRMTPEEYEAYAEAYGQWYAS